MFKEKMFSLLSKLGYRQKDNTQNLKTRLIKGAISIFGLKSFSMGLGFLISLILARILGASDYGLYVYIFQIMDVLVLLGNSGIDSLIVRDGAIYKSNSDWGLLHGLLKWSNQFVLGFCSLLIIISIIILFSLGDQISAPFRLSFLIGILFLPIACVRNLNISTMTAFQQFFKGHLPEFFIRPILLISSIICAYFILAKNVNTPIIAGIHVTVSGICLFIIMLLLNQTIPKIVWQETPKYEIKKWLKTSLPLLFSASLYIFYTNIDSLMLGVMKGFTLVGIYDVVVKGKLIIYMVIQAMSGVLQPNIATLYAQGELKQIQKIVTKSSRILMLMISIIILILVFFSKEYLSLFGAEYIEGKTALILICIVAIIDNFAPFNILLLNMTGHERYTIIAIGLSSVLNVVLNFLLIPQWGLIGLIVATAFSVLLLNIYATVIVHKKMKINCTIFVR